MRAALALTLLLAACGAGNGGPSRQPLPGEGTLCNYPGGGCTPSSLTCGNLSAYQCAYGVCRVPCSAGCPSGESCASVDQTCRCTPGASDSCAAIGLVCNPGLYVCQQPQTSTSCTYPLTYSKVSQLCTATSCP